MKRIQRPLILACLTLFLMIGFPACGGDDYAAIRGIASTHILDRTTNTFLSSPAITSSDSIILLINPEIDFFSFHPTVSGSMSEAIAFQPQDPWMANEIRAIRIYCNNLVYGIPAGQDLAGELLYGFDHSLKYSLEEYIASLPKKGDDYYHGSNEIYIFLPSKPASGDYVFSIEIEDNNGHVFMADFLNIQWQ